MKSNGLNNRTKGNTRY